MRVLGIVPARGGSKGVPRKNIRLLAGKPLLAWTAEAALAATRLARVILSTDDEEIAAVGRRYGLEVPFLRPPELARDNTPMLPVVEHAVRSLQEAADAICLLQPSSPFRRAADIDACVDLLAGTGADSVVSVLEVPDKYNPHWVYFRDPDGFLKLSTGEPAPIGRRQDLPPAFYRDGSVYVTRTSVLLESHSLYGTHVAPYIMDSGRSVNIDTLQDWQAAERAAEFLLATHVRH